MRFVLAGVPNVRRQSQGRFSAAPENLLVVSVGELLWEFQNKEGAFVGDKYNDHFPFARSCPGGAKLNGNSSVHHGNDGKYLKK